MAGTHYYEERVFFLDQPPIRSIPRIKGIYELP